GSVAAFIRSVPPALAALAFGLGALTAWVYWPTLVGMWQKWDHDPQYSHGYLVPLFAVVLLGLRHQRLQEVTFRLNAWGIPLRGIGALLRIGTSSRLLYSEWLEAASLLPTLAGLFVLLGGRPALRWAWPSILFLLFMIPLPFRVENMLSEPLRRVATLGS